MNRQNLPKLSKSFVDSAFVTAFDLRVEPSLISLIVNDEYGHSRQVDISHYVGKALQMMLLLKDGD